MKPVEQDIEKYREGLHRKLLALIDLMEDAYAEYQKSAQLRKNSEQYLAVWFPKWIAELKKHEQAAAHSDTAYSAARALDGLGQAFDGNYDWYKGGNLKLASVNVSVLARAYSGLITNDPLRTRLCKRADAALT